ncbi:glutamate formiminotransferase [Longilinea arvoryzae]|uniref:Formimidoyltransferase-cyclodeaminase n=1 Tax=Longilinea arvoryzae TaxID=360412 RepID=A0A0S7BK19_9CHLR|nr:glutamate formimidoyltransferase [Longilinea arvoryzae]GAP14149.1 glutamate formiminotransferase [Longilinea arvoryzae]
MPSPLVECIPNFSEARRPEVVESILAAITDVQGVHVLDRHSDLDHNRTVLTFVGSPAAVEEAAYQGIARAAQLIDLNQHTGAHPRIGATDVVPFVPITDFTMQECVEMARRLGKRVGDELSIPVYLYEDAATKPEHQNLENIRHGQYEALKEEMGVNPARDPDFGPHKVGPAGATVIGARAPLIAFNVYLTTNEVSIAQKIAKAVRHSNGGLRYVKAMGVMVEGRAQVSMNLTNYHQTPVARVVEFVRREAARYGVGIHHSELVGLLPQDALTNAAIWYLQLDDFQPDQILESRLYELLRSPTQAAAAAQQPDFIDQLASSTPTPGGGAAAAHTGAAAAALVAMVGRGTLTKKKYEAVKDQMWALVEQAESLRTELAQAVDEDCAAFDAVMAAFKLPKDTPEQQTARAQAVQAATLLAAQVPLKVAGKALDVQKLALQAAADGNLNAITDAGSASALAHAALTCAAYNVRTNLLSLEDEKAVVDLKNQLRILETSSTEQEGLMHKVLVERGGISLG